MLQQYTDSSIQTAVQQYIKMHQGDVLGGLCKVVQFDACWDSVDTAADAELHCHVVVAVHS